MHADEGDHDPKIDVRTPIDQGSSLEHSLAEYSRDLYEAGIAAKERIERKAHFYLSFVGIFLGAVFLKHDFLSALALILKDNQHYSVTVAASYFFLIALGCFVIVTLIGIVGTMSVRRYKHGGHTRLDEWLDAQEAARYQHHANENLHLELSRNYSIAAMRNSRNNDRKGWWLLVASYGVIGVSFGLAGLLGCILSLTMR